MFKYTKKEVKHIIIASLILAFVFAFNDKQTTFNISYYISNFLLAILSSFMVILTYAFFQKLVAYHYKAETEYSIWSIERYYFTESSKIKIKIGKKIINKLPLSAIIAIIATLVSKGRFYFAALSSFKLKEKKHLRLHHTRPNVTNYELALIALAGPLSNLVLAIAFKSIQPELFKNFITINLFHSFYCMIPLSQLDGAKIFFGSRYLYAFSLTIILTALILINFIPIAIMLIIAITLALVATIAIFNSTKST